MARSPGHRDFAPRAPLWPARPSLPLWRAPGLIACPLRSCCEGRRSGAGSFHFVENPPLVPSPRLSILHSPLPSLPTCTCTCTRHPFPACPSQSRFLCRRRLPVCELDCAPRLSAIRSTSTDQDLSPSAGGREQIAFKLKPCPVLCCASAVKGSPCCTLLHDNPPPRPPSLLYRTLHLSPVQTCQPLSQSTPRLTLLLLLLLLLLLQPTFCPVHRHSAHQRPEPHPSATTVCAVLLPPADHPCQ